MYRSSSYNPKRKSAAGTELISILFVSLFVLFAPRNCNLNFKNYIILGETTIIRPPETCGHGDEGRYRWKTNR